jgi:hypothetical protein
MFQGTVVLSSSGSRRPREKKLLALLDPEDKGTIILATSGTACLMTHHHIPDDFKHAVNYLMKRNLINNVMLYSAEIAVAFCR